MVVSASSSRFGEMAERSKAPRSGRGLFGGVGSNPTLISSFFCFLLVESLFFFFGVDILGGGAPMAAALRLEESRIFCVRFDCLCVRMQI